MFETRLRYLYPLFGLKWCMIMLNPFLTDYKSNRLNDSNLKWNQLFKVKRKLSAIKSSYSQPIFLNA